MNPSATVPLDYGCRVEMQAPGPAWAEQPICGTMFSFYVGHTSQTFEPSDRGEDIQRYISDLVHHEYRLVHACAYPPGGLPSTRRSTPVLYRITRKNIRWVYDDFTSIVVRASSEDEAREAAVAFIEQEALKFSGSKFDRIWSNRDETEISRIQEIDGPQVISAEFRHG